MGTVYGFSPLSVTRWSWSPSGSVTPQREQLRVYQVVLGFLGHGPTNASALDGLMGPTTERSLRAYQLGAGLPVTGQFDPATTTSLNGDVARLVAAGRHPIETAANAATWNANNSGGRPAAAVGTHPKVNTIATATGPVAVPESVSKMIPPSTVAQLQTMPAAAAQSFVADLSNKVATGQATGNDLIDGGTGKDVAVTAVPVIGPNGTVTAGIATAPAGWWASLSDNEKAAWIAGGTLVGVGTLAALVSIASAPRGR